MISHPEHSAEAKSFFLLEKRLRSLAVDCFEDFDPSLSFWPPRPPGAAARDASKSYVLLSSTAVPVSATEPVTALFEGGVCRKCKLPMGARSMLPLVFNFAELCGADFGVVSRRVVISTEFAYVLAGKEMPSDFIACKNSGVSNGKRYLEFDSAPSLHSVPVRGARKNLMTVWKCGVCGSTGLPTRSYNGLSVYLRKTELDKKLAHGWAAVSTLWTLVSFVVDVKKVDPMQFRGLREVTAEWIGAIDDSQVWVDAPVSIIGCNGVR